MVLSLDRWRGKVAVVTGASAGIGASIVEKLVEEGLEVVGIARRSELVEEQAKKLSGKKGKLYAVQADLSKEEDIVRAFKWVSDNVGPVHILINNAGLLNKNTLIDGDAKKWKQIFDVNVIGLCIATREAVRIMKANNIDGHIVHINSAAGHRIPNVPGMNVYPASKYAVTALTETLRQELNQIGTKVKITSVSPGAVETEFAEANKFTTNEAIRKIVPAWLKAEDVTSAVLYTLSTPPHVQVHEIILLPLGQSPPNSSS